MNQQIMFIPVPVDEFWSKVETIIDTRIKANLPNKDLKANTYSVTRTAKILRRGNPAIEKMMEAGILKPTADGRIPQSEIEKYLDNNL